jgi:hypothetical protein
MGGVWLSNGVYRAATKLTSSTKGRFWPIICICALSHLVSQLQHKPKRAVAKDPKQLSVYQPANLHRL